MPEVIVRNILRLQKAEILVGTSGKLFHNGGVADNRSTTPTDDTIWRQKGIQANFCLALI